MKRSIIAAGIASAAALMLTGCASVNSQSSGYDLSRIDPHVTLNKTTPAEVRELLGTPTAIAKTSEGDLIFGYAFVGHNTGAVWARNLGKSAATLGLGAKKYEFTLKNPMFRFKDGVLVDFKKDGVAFLIRGRFSRWNECELKLTPEEINSPANFSDAEICSRFADAKAAEKGIPVEKVDIGEEFKSCNLPCQVRRQMYQAFPNIVWSNDLIDAEPNDGKRIQDVF